MLNLNNENVFSFAIAGWTQVKLVLILLLLSNSSFSQQANLEFAKVSPLDVKMTDFPSEPGSSAVILAKTRSMEIKTEPAAQQVIKHFERIKLLKESSFYLGEVVIEYYHFEELESIEFLRANITYPDGKQLLLNKEHVEVSEIDNEWTSVVIKFPNLVKGCIIEYQYTLVKNYISAPEDFIFQYEIPLRYASLTHKIAADVNYVFFAQGEDYIKVGKDNFVMENVPSIKEDAFITVMEDYRGKIKTRIESYFDPYLGNQVISPKTERIVSKLLNDRLFGSQYKKESLGRNILKSAKFILEDDAPILERIDSLQDFILSNVVWNGSMDLRCTKPIRKLFTEGSAGSTELNFMMISLLRNMDVEAKAVLLSSRNEGQAYSVFPVESEFKYAAVLAEVDGAMIILDISDKLKPATLLNYQALNKFGLVVERDNPYWIKITPETSTDIYLGEFKVEDRELRGEFNTKHRKHSAFFERDYTRDDSFLDHWRLKFQKRYPRAHIYNGSHENLSAIDQEFKQKFSIDIPSAVTFIEDTIIVDPFIIGAFDKNPFRLNKREYEIDFAYPISEQYIFRLEIPSGYKILSLPQKYTVTTPEQTSTFLIDPSIVKNQIQIIKKIDLRMAVYPAEESEGVITVFKEMDKRTKEKIVLIKKK